MVRRERSPLGSDIHPIGHLAHVTPVPPVPENTRYFEAGPLRIAVEHRLLNNKILEAHFGEGGDYDQVPDLEGFSIHVFDAGAGVERLRFDMFAGDLHYHYILEPSLIISVGYDEVANGPMFDWSLQCLTTRLPEMLRTAGAGDLADRVSQDELIDVSRKIGEIAAQIKNAVAGWPQQAVGSA